MVLDKICPDARLFGDERYGACPRGAASFELDREGGDFEAMGSRQRSEVHLVYQTKRMFPAGIVNRVETIHPAGAERVEHGSDGTIYGLAVATNDAHALFQEPAKGVEFQADRSIREIRIVTSLRPTWASVSATSSATRSPHR